jgi:hypothetical protein
MCTLVDCTVGVYVTRLGLYGPAGLRMYVRAVMRCSYR